MNAIVKCIEEEYAPFSILWASDGWLTLDGRLLASALEDEEKRRHETRGIVPIETIHGGVMQSVTFEHDRAMIRLQNGDTAHLIELRRDGSTVPLWRSTGERKAFSADESLEDVIVVSRRARLWVTE